MAQIIANHHGSTITDDSKFANISINENAIQASLSNLREKTIPPPSL